MNELDVALTSEQEVFNALVFEDVGAWDQPAMNSALRIPGMVDRIVGYVFSGPDADLLDVALKEHRRKAVWGEDHDLHKCKTLLEVVDL